MNNTRNFISFDFLSDHGIFNIMNTKFYNAKDKNFFNKTLIEELKERNIVYSNIHVTMQTHSLNINENLKNDEINFYENTDALFSNSNKDLLCIKFADCVPIVLFDCEKKFLLCMHSGWRGTLNKFILKGIDFLTDKGSSPENLILFIGPSISLDSFEVDYDVYRMFKQSYSDLKSYSYASGNKYHIDLKALNKENAIKNGISEKNIYISDIDTYKSEYLHSFRRDKEKYGLMSLICKIK